MRTSGVSCPTILAFASSPPTCLSFSPSLFFWVPSTLHVSLLPPLSPGKIAVVPQVKASREVPCGMQILQSYACFPAVLATEAAKYTLCLPETCVPPLLPVLPTPNNAFHKATAFTKTAVDSPALAVNGGHHTLPSHCLLPGWGWQAPFSRQLYCCLHLIIPRLHTQPLLGSQAISRRKKTTKVRCGQ